MTSTLQPALAAWDGISQKMSEREGLLASKPGTPRSTWQGSVALLLLGIVTALSLVLCGVVWQLTVKVDRLSRSVGAETTAFPATELNAFPLLVTLQPFLRKSDLYYLPSAVPAQSAACPHSDHCRWTTADSCAARMASFLQKTAHVVAMIAGRCAKPC